MKKAVCPSLATVAAVELGENLVVFLEEPFLVANAILLLIGDFYLEVVEVTFLSISLLRETGLLAIIELLLAP